MRINIYLTQKISEDMLWNIAVNDAGAEYDPLTLLRTRTMFGRPDWKNIFARMSQAIQTSQYLPGSNSQLKTTVGVSCHSSHVPEVTEPLTYRYEDVLLQSRWPREDHQGGNPGGHLLLRQLHFRQGEKHVFGPRFNFSVELTPSNSPGTLLDARRRRGCVIRCPRMPLYASRSVEVLSSSPLCVRAVL